MDTDFPISCTGDAVTGDVIQFEEGVFGGSFRNPKFLWKRLVEGVIKKDSYGADKQQHTFSIEVILTKWIEPLVPWTMIKRKWRNVYRNGTSRQPWDDENARILARWEKHMRGIEAREIRDFRRSEEARGFTD